ncbi:Smr/MutS family protein [Propionivibrio limicola]|uniref:Smr/MutS family protein n=1 Tax=Propionivibrio limicola TaxID=167645 RepID=UPI0012927782|nr:Smr/MutS family protein [Propionivibrio limicola]
MRQRPPTEEISAEDLDAFLAAIEGTQPLRTPARVVHEPPKPRPRPRQRELDDIEVIRESLHGPFEIDDLLAIGDTFLRPGLPRDVLRDLRRGRWAIQNHTDLHGMNRHEAHDEIARFLAESRLTGKRCLRIVHGRGRGSPGREGVLKRLVKTWLSRHRDVLAFCHAAPCDGGEGALWVLLRANRER